MKSVIAMLVFLSFGMALQAQSARNEEGRKEAREAMDEFFREIGVTDQQMAQIETLREEMQKEMEALRSKGQRPETSEDMGKIREEHDAGMEEILTEEQFEKYKAKQRELRAKGQKRRTKAVKPN